MVMDRGRANRIGTGEPSAPEAAGGSFRNDHLAFLSYPSPERSSVRFDPHLEADDLGFRVIRIPEPSRLLLQVVALSTVLVTAARRRQRTRTENEHSDRER